MLVQQVLTTGGYPWNPPVKPGPTIHIVDRRSTGQSAQILLVDVAGRVSGGGDAANFGRGSAWLLVAGPLPLAEDFPGLDVQ